MKVTNQKKTTLCFITCLKCNVVIVLAFLYGLELSKRNEELKNLRDEDAC
jgi:hypothetical protein